MLQGTLAGCLILMCIGPCHTELSKGKWWVTSSSHHELVIKGLFIGTSSRYLPDLVGDLLPNFEEYQFFYHDLSESCVISSHLDV